MPTQQLVFFVEGKGDHKAVPCLAKRVLGAMFGADCPLRVDFDPFVVRSLGNLTCRDYANWKKWIGAASRRPEVSGVVLVLDADSDFLPSPAPARTPFCAASAAKVLASRAKEAGAGTRLSLAVVFACREFEAWLIAGSSGFAHLLRPGFVVPNELESLRNAKGTLSHGLITGYRAGQNQESIAKLANIQEMQTLRSFQRFENALRKLVEAHTNHKKIVTPE